MGDGSSSAPSLVSIQERYCLNQVESDKQTFHLVLKFEAFPFSYEVGDCIGVYPINDAREVSPLLPFFSDLSCQVITREGRSVSFLEFLEKKAHLGKITPKLCNLALKNGLSASIVDHVEMLVATSKSEYKKFLETTSISTFLSHFPKNSFDPQEFCNSLAPLAPRYYSIASSRKSVGDEIHLTVALSKASLGEKQYLGVCSNYLCQIATLKKDQIAIFHHPAKDFKLFPETKSKPIIMIGPGTGIAPFRGFLQERFEQNEVENWLFFGERREKFDFYYQEFLEELALKGYLRLTTAFSRDQAEKIYVQHKMATFSSEIWNWVERGAYIYVCGDAERMAKEVDQVLLQIFKKQGNLSDIASKDFLKHLRLEKRYLKDVY